MTHTLTQTNYITVISADAFQEEDGLVTLEAEHFQDRLNGPSHTWNTRTDLPGCAGYLTHPPQKTGGLRRK